MTKDHRPGEPGSEQDELAYARHLTEPLQAGEDNLSDEIVARLYEARQQALDVTRQPQAKSWWLPTIGVGMTGAAAVLVVVLLLPVSDAITPLPVGEDVELAAAQDLDLLEDLEFVAWMVAMEESDKLGSSG